RTTPPRSSSSFGIGTEAAHASVAAALCAAAAVAVAVAVDAPVGAVDGLGAPAQAAPRGRMRMSPARRAGRAFVRVRRTMAVSPFSDLAHGSGQHAPGRPRGPQESPGAVKGARPRSGLVRVARARRRVLLVGVYPDETCRLAVGIDGEPDASPEGAV